MKTSPDSHVPARPGQKGFALIMVVVILALVAVVATYFLSSVTAELKSAKLYADSSQIQKLSDLSVNEVMARISAATLEGARSGTPRSWASQPGMIRTYDTSGDLSAIYKLYSWNNPYQTGPYNPFATAELPPSSWPDDTAIYTDLNEPIDINPLPGVNNWVWPIVDPNAGTGADSVEGFSVTTTNPAVSSATHDAPMPVQWLYVLEDGTLTSPTGGGTTATVTGASDTNPIVARIAFWTDDETSKVNINTASEGAYWDWPKAATRDEMQFAGNPPVAGEYHRTPGHPAMTSLSAVLPSLDPGDRWGSTSSYRSLLETLMGFLPRQVFDSDSSRGGTYPIDNYNFNYSPSTGFATGIPDEALIPDSDRLFTTADELLFQPDRSRIASIGTNVLRERAFFLTANSRGPETTLFETPRISLWPVTWEYPAAHQNNYPNRQTTSASSSPDPDSTPITSNDWMRPEEKLLAFNASLNTTSGDGDRYYFQRQNPDSPTHDYTQISRNQQLIDYLQALTDEDVPGFGGSFASKYGSSTRDFLLVNGFNAIRSLVNQYTVDPAHNDGRLLYSYTPVSFRNFTLANGSPENDYWEIGAYNTMPLRINPGSGEIQSTSEFPMLREVSLVFFATNRNDPAFTGADPNNPFDWLNLINLDPLDSYPDGSQTTEMRAVLLLDFAPITGSTGENFPVFWVGIGGTDPTANGQGLQLTGSTTQIRLGANFSGEEIAPYLRSLFQYQPNGNVSAPKTFNNGTSSNTNYGLISNPVTVPSSGTTFPFNGGPITVEIYGLSGGNPDTDPTGNSNLRVATYTVDLSAWTGTLPTPLSPRWTYHDRANEVSNCPNPRYNAFDYASTPAVNETTLNTAWAATEIAPIYRTADPNEDPANGGTQSTAAFNQLFNTDPTDGRIIYQSSSHWFFNNAVTYAARDKGGDLMTDYEKRLHFLLDGLDRGIGATTPLLAENSGLPLAPKNTDDAFDPGGFPAITPYDTVISVVPDPTAPNASDGDLRLASQFQFDRITDVIPSSTTLREIIPYTEYPRATRQWHALGSLSQAPSATGYQAHDLYSLLGNAIAPNGMALSGATTVGTNKAGNLGTRAGVSVGDARFHVGVASSIPLDEVSSASVGDWTSAPGNRPDGGILVRPDQDFQTIDSTNTTGNAIQTPYFVDFGNNTGASGGYFSANRQIPSPITLLGSLPSSQTTGWQALLFSPNPAAGSSHPGLNNPPDHLLADLFWMPVVEPYPISDQLSTAGKINLNYQILPFPYIERKSGLHALMKSTWITALHNDLVEEYKSHHDVRALANSQTRYEIDIDQTLERFDSEIFSGGDLFRSASQLSEMWLVPEGESSSSVENFWNDKLLTSDTAREEPYNHLYSRITTRSNTYTVHWKVQSLQKNSSTPADTWDETLDQVTGQARGSTLIERFIDPNATNIPDYAANTTAILNDPLTNYYQWRIVSESRFSP